LSNLNDQGHRGLQQASDFPAVFLAMAAHDLRQPLQEIMSVYDWLARRRHTRSEQEYLRRGIIAIARLSGQLDQLIEALRVHEHSANIQLAPVSLQPILHSLFHENEDLGVRKGITLRVRQTDAAVVSHSLLLECILRNLIRNALKYTDPGGHVLISFRPRGEFVKIEVRDTGIGISADQLSQIFDAFQRLDSTHGDGLGLGLFVVRRAVDLLGHAIEVRSTVGVGSCFSVIARTHHAACGQKPTNSAASTGKSGEDGPPSRKNPLPTRYHQGL
jgi:two-component system, OmpR family, phosphate regulon sensor histidine kinase PhoR